MSEHAPNKTVSSLGMNPAPTSNYKSSGPAHHVKKLIETYNKTAERSMAGPSATELPFKMYSELHHPFHSQVRGQTYKLPPDVELSKSSPEDTPRTCDDNTGDDLSLIKRNSNLDTRDSPNDRQTSDFSSQQFNEEFKHIQKNGQVTLSRVGDSSRKRHGSPQSENHHAKICENSYGGSSGRHLTGDMIRQLQHQTKETRIPPPPPSVQQQQLLDINACTALYEKVLQEKSYLPANQRPGNQQLPPSFKSPASAGPVFLPRDRGHTDLQLTKLAGREILCFNIGGEKRLCLPQIINTVLAHVSLHEINSVCDELRIFCATCTQDQLSKLKSAKIIPMSAAHSVLITKSDAERLCSIFLDSSPPLASQCGFRAKSSPFSFRVQHFCFGSCTGILLPEAYTSPSATCIECIECEGLFSPQKFVCHAHRNCERRTCHWGFDSANWRSYLLLADDYTKAQKDGLSKSYADFKARYNPTKRKHRDSMLTDYGLGNSYSCDLIVKEEVKPVHMDGPTQSKRARINDPPLQGAMPAIYQTWAKLSAESGGSLHPATIAAAWSKHLTQTQTAKEKDILGLNKALSVDLVTGALCKPSIKPRVPDLKAICYPLNLKSSPVVESGSPLQASSPSRTLSPSSGGPLMSSSISSTSSPSLAEDIHSIRLALDGASSNAREKILKILENLTARLAQAEADRDNAMRELQSLHKRFDEVEDELHKKRAELREALCQDSGIVGLHQTYKKVNGEGIHRAGGHNDPLRSTFEPDEHQKAFRQIGLPKVNLKSPARIIEERERLGPIALSVRYGSGSSSPSSLSGGGGPPPASSPSGSERRLHRRRSDTPASVKSRESEDLKERMLTMEAELRSLREELMHRPAAKRSRSSSTDKSKDKPNELPNQPGQNNIEVAKCGDNTPKVLPKSNGESDLAISPVASTKTEDDKNITEKEDSSENLG